MRHIIALAGALLPIACLGQTAYYAHTDINGNVVAVTDKDRNVVERRVYEPYGLPMNPIDDGPGFTSHDMDGESGLVYMQQRYYDSSIGRFLSVDPMGVDSRNAWNFNRYSYAANNPTTNYDPTGAVCISRYNRSSPMCLRSVNYERTHADRAISSKTSFFGAAAMMTSAMALPGPSAFMESLSAKLELENTNRANQIRAGELYGTGSVRQNDIDFIHFEQSFVQAELNAFQARDPSGYDSLIADTNGALNGLSGGRGLARISDPNVAKAIASARETIGGDIDFANQEHREILGQAAADIARRSRSVCTGSHFRAC